MSRGTARVGLAVALLVLGTGIGSATVDRLGGAAGPTEVDVVGATAACPDGPVTVGSTGTGSGVLRSRALDAASTGLPPTSAGEVVAGVAGTVVAARGAAAGGLGAEVVTRVDDGAVRGLTAVRCTPVGGSSWFVGGSTVVGQAAELVLVNADAAEAAVDVRAWSTDGPLEERPGRGLAVPPRSRVSVPLDRLAPDRELLALHVTTRRGRVTPYVRTTRSDGRTPQASTGCPRRRPPRPGRSSPACRAARAAGPSCS